MTDADHVALAKLLRKLKGMVIISSYPSPLYDGLYRGWRKVSWTGGQFCSQNTGSKTRTEVVWMNPACADAQRQSSLF
jgi:DNA adenine methylase